MVSDTFFGLVALLYYVCFLLLSGLTLLIACRGRRRARKYSRLRRTFLLLAISLALWQVTLFLEVRTAVAVAQLWLGRINFAAVAAASYLAFRFVAEVPGQGSTKMATPYLLLSVETVLLTVVTLLTRLIDAKERVEAGHAITTFGWMFPFYLLHVVGCLGGAIVLAFMNRRAARDPRLRRQLTLIGVGMLVTGAIAIVTNAVLPYWLGDFRFCDVGTISTVFFVLSIAYATFVNRLFDLRIVIRETLVFGLLLAFVLGTYSSSVFVITQYLTTNAGKLTQFVVLMIAFSVDPIRRYLEKKTDRLLFGSHRGSRRGGSLNLALLFPWRRP